MEFLGIFPIELPFFVLLCFLFFFVVIISENTVFVLVECSFSHRHVHLYVSSSGNK